jgi:hypothetical protein
MTKKLGVTVLADEAFAAAAPGDWSSAGEIEIRDYDRRIEVFTLVACQSAASAPVPAIRQPAG